MQYLAYSDDERLLKLPVVYMMLIGDRFYIGSAMAFGKRIKSHLHKLRRGDHHNRFIQFAYDKHSDVRFAVVESFSQGTAEHKVRSAEEHYLDLCFCDKRCMNIMPSTEIASVTRSKRVVVDGVVHKSIGEVACLFGVTATTITTWLTGTKPVPLRFDFKEFRFEGGESVFRRKKPHRSVVVNGSTYESASAVARYFGFDKASVYEWLAGTSPLPLHIGITELRYEDEQQSKVFHRPSKRSVIVDGEAYSSIASVADRYGTTASTVSSWLHGRRPIPSRYGITKLQYADGSPTVTYAKKGKKPDIVVVDGVHMERHEALRTLGVDTKKLSSWITGAAPIPARYGIRSVYNYGSSDRSRFEPKKKPVILNGSLYESCNAAAHSVGVADTTMLGWLKGRCKPSAKYNIHSLHYA